MKGVRAMTDLHYSHIGDLDNELLATRRAYDIVNHAIERCPKWNMVRVIGLMRTRNKLEEKIAQIEGTLQFERVKSKYSERLGK
jgi:hypothetical protein